jgi:hypothetical protein
MKVIPLAFDSMGVRSMCTFIEADTPVLIDPGVSLAPRRYGLPPHSIEIDTLMEKRAVIQEYSSQAAVIVISHWHNDHFTPFLSGLYGSVTPELARSVYAGKSVLAKGISGLNYMQMQRARAFLTHQQCAFLDATTYTFGDMTIVGSPSVDHGGQKIPVVMIRITDTPRSVVFASDTQGLAGIDFITAEEPNTVIMSGPPISLLSTREVETSKRAILKIATHCDELILDHHHVRDPHFKEALPEIWRLESVKTAAEYAGNPNRLLETHRRELYSGETGL